MARSNVSRSIAVLVPLAVVISTGCDDPPKPKPASTASATVGTPPPPKPKTMPELLVDEDGPYLGGTRIKLSDTNGPEKLLKTAKDLPIGGNPVALRVEKKAKVSAVAATVAALGEAGAPKVILKTDGRNDLPKELSVTPQDRVHSPNPCSLVASLLKDLSTAVWPLRGGLAKKTRKGLAGPDLTHTGEALEKDLTSCDSTVAFFSGDDSTDWESTFNLAGTVLVSDKKKKIDTLVLLREEPVAGRPIALGKH